MAFPWGASNTISGKISQRMSPELDVRTNGTSMMMPRESVSFESATPKHWMMEITSFGAMMEEGWMW